MVSRPAPASEIIEQSDDLGGSLASGVVMRAVHGVALGIAFLLAASITAIILVFAAATLYVVVRMALGG
ncbi:MAG TPA: hypothetical protein VFN57_13340 [Thermomicrobiaceae bacterium]|nr:hypothetical protein [Thermomicrobiaceae bacterium]